jgi:hypothetical protein
MERRSKEENAANSSDDSGSEPTTIELIKTLAANNARAELNNEEQLLLFLQSWWSRTYNRPLKDPLLLSYSLEELLYEFYDRIERSKSESERLEQDDVKMEEDKERAALDWAEQEEKRELEAAMKKEAAEESTKSQNVDQTKDPENIAWMEEQLKQAKQVYGDSFGEDINENFEE